MSNIVSRWKLPLSVILRQAVNRLLNRKPKIQFKGSYRMPNYVKNIITMHGDEADRIKVKEYIKSKETAFDFNKLIPMPSALNIECSSISNDSLIIYRYLQNKDEPSKDMKKLTTRLREKGETVEMMIERLKKEGRIDLKLGKQAFDNIRKYDAPDFYYWRIKNWGTKWNAVDAAVYENETIEFDTAWSAPLSVISALSAKFPNVEFDYKWSDEDIGQNCGEGTFIKGGSVDLCFYSDCEQDALRLYEECWGETDCIGVENGKYYRRTCDTCHRCD